MPERKWRLARGALALRARHHPARLRPRRRRRLAAWPRRILVLPRGRIRLRPHRPAAAVPQPRRAVGLCRGPARHASLWAVAEVGLDWWPLAARGDIVFVFGLLLLLPWFTAASHDRRIRSRAAGAMPAAARRRAALSAMVAIAAGVRDPHDRRAAAGRRRARCRRTGGVPDGEWHAYGRGRGGQRYSPLAQITPDNVGELQVAWHFRTGDMRGARRSRARPPTR